MAHREQEIVPARSLRAARSSYRVPIAITVFGVMVAVSGMGAMFIARRTAGAVIIASWGATLVGAALMIAGAASLLFVLATNSSLEWFVAWRYLRRNRRSWATLLVGLTLLVSSGAIVLLATWLAPHPIADITIDSTRLVRILHWVAAGLAVLGWLVFIFGALLLSFSVFTCISIFGVHLGTGALVVVLSVMGGFEQDLRQKILGTRAHIVITKPHDMFTDYRKVVDQVASMAGIVAVSPYLESEVMITSQSNLEGILLHGIDPLRISRVTDLPRYMKAEGGAGSLNNLLHPERLARIPAVPFEPLAVPPPPGAADDAPAGHAGHAGGAEKQARTGPVERRPVYPGLIVGAELARNLRLYVGDDVNLVAPLGGMSPAGPIPKSRPFRIAGIFYSGMYEYDTKFAYVTTPEAQRFLGLADEITGIEVKVADVNQAVKIADRVRHRVGSRFDVRDWQQLNRNLFSALKLEKLVMFIVLTFIVLVASFSIVTNLIMVVLEKGKEIAALKAIGSTARSVLRIFVYAGLYIGLIGMLVGVLEGVGICAYLARVGLPLDPEVYYIARLPVRMHAPDIAVVALAAVTLSFLATIYPALRAAHLRPVDGLRYE